MNRPSMFVLAALLLALAAAGCGRPPAVRVEAARSGQAVGARETPLSWTARFMRQMGVIFGGVNNAGRASNVKMFDR